MSQEARHRLADLRYERGTKAFVENDYDAAVRWLTRLLPDISLVRFRTPKGSLLPEPQRVQKRDYAIFGLGEACERTNRWVQAAVAYEALAVPGASTEEMALFKLIGCYTNTGEHTRARDARERLEKRFPNSPYTRAAQVLM